MGFDSYFSTPACTNCVQKTPYVCTRAVCRLHEDPERFGRLRITAFPPYCLDMRNPPWSIGRFFGAWDHSLCAPAAGIALGARQPAAPVEPIPVKVVVVTMFEIGG